MPESLRRKRLERPWGVAYMVETGDDHRRKPTTMVTMEDLRAGRVDLADAIEPGERILGPVHPGEILADVLKELNLSAYALAKAIGVPVNRVTAILAGERAISADKALRLTRFFGTSAEMWMTLQADYDLEVTRAARGAAIEAEITPHAA